MTLDCFVKRGNLPLPAGTETITSLQEFHARTDCHHLHRRHASEFKSRATQWGRSCPTNKWGFRVTLHRKVSETALVQLLRSLRALAPDFQISLEICDRPVEQLTRQQACYRIALRALGTLERTNETAFMNNLKLFDSMLPPTLIQSDNLLRLVKLDLANKDAPTVLMQASGANIKNLVSIGQNRSMRLYFFAHPTDYVWPSSLPKPGVPLDEGSDTSSLRWLALVYEAGFATQAPLLQHGFLRLHGGSMRPFQRFIYPITPPQQRPSNYRVRRQWN